MLKWRTNNTRYRPMFDNDNNDNIWGSSDNSWGSSSDSSQGWGQEANSFYNNKSDLSDSPDNNDMTYSQSDGTKEDIQYSGYEQESYNVFKKKENRGCLVSILAYLSIFIVIPIFIAIWKSFFGTDQKSLDAIGSAYFIVASILTIVGFVSFYRNSCKCDKILKASLKQTLNLSFDITKCWNTDDPDEERDTGSFTDCSTEAIFKRLHLVYSSQLIKPYSRVTDVIEGKRSHLDFRFEDSEVWYPGKNGGTIFEGQVFIFRLENTITRWMQIGVLNNLPVCCYFHNRTENLNDLNYMMKSRDYKLNAPIENHVAQPISMDTLANYHFAPETVDKVVKELHHHLECDFTIYLADDYLYLLVNSKRNIFEPETAPRKERQDINSEDAYTKATRTCREDVEWVAQIIEIMSELHEHGLR